MSRANAERIICSDGWLSHMSEAFRKEMLQHALLLKFEPDTTIFRPGDPMGGIYGLVSGTVRVNTAPLDSTPRLIHIGLPGAWTGEDSFMTGDPRRIELRTVSETWLMHVPLETMERLTARDPNIIRAFGVISILSSDVLLRVVHDLQKKDASERIASVLHRMAWTTDVAIPLSQDSLAAMANASRKQVNMAIQRFTAAGWVERGYRSVIIRDILALREYAEREDAG